jgi:hypothetical protein
VNHTDDEHLARARGVAELDRNDRPAVDGAAEQNAMHRRSRGAACEDQCRNAEKERNPPHRRTMPRVL